MRSLRQLRAEHRAGRGTARFAANKDRVALMHKTHEAEKLVKRTFQDAKRSVANKLKAAVKTAFDVAKQLVASGTPPAEAARLAARQVAQKSGVAGMGCGPCRR